jgi:glutaredoxin-like protein NrdH
MLSLTHKPGKKADHKVIFYGLSTCGWCRRTKEFLDAHDIAYQYCYVDQQQGEERTEAVNRVRELNPRGSYPTLEIDGQVVVGYDEERLTELLGL